MADSQHIKLTREGGVATVSIESKTMPPAFFGELRAAFDEISADDSLRCVILRSNTKAFTYGLDLRSTFAEHGKLFAGGGTTERRALLALIKEWQASNHAVESCPIPVIAAVHGHCIGGGMDLVTACDIRLCSDDASFSVRETKIAIVADLGTLQRLPRIVGSGIARELAFTGRDVSAAEAVSIGLCNRSLPDREALWSHVAELAGEIAANSPLAVRGTKQVMNYGDEHGARAGFEYVAAWNAAFLASQDLAEAVAAFAQKRDPAFKGT